MFGLLWCFGCAVRAAPAFSAAHVPQPLVVLADWDDVVPAVRTAAGQLEMAVEHISHPDDRTVQAALRTAGAHPGSLTARRLEDGPGGRSRIALWAAVRRFGDPEKERALLGAVERRLLDLAGRDFAPIR